jgi:hypothetical protein
MGARAGTKNRLVDWMRAEENIERAKNNCPTNMIRVRRIILELFSGVVVNPGAIKRSNWGVKRMTARERKEKVIMVILITVEAVFQASSMWPLEISWVIVGIKAVETAPIIRI